MRYIFIIMLLTPSLYAANEIQSFAVGATTCYAVVREYDGDVWYPTGTAFEIWGTGARTAADYDIALTDKSGWMFVGDFDTNISAGYYHIITHMQVGGSPADTDPAVWAEHGYWDDDEWFKNATYQDVNDIAGSLPSAADVADAVWDEAFADHTTETTFGGEVGGLDPNITLILADTDELQTDWTDGGRLDSILDDINDVTSILEIINTTVSDANDANSFTLTAGADVNDAYIGNTIYVQDADDSEWGARMIIDWTSSKVVTVEEPFGFTPAVGDVVVIWKDYFPMRVYWEIPKRIPPDPIIIDRRASVSGGGITTIDAEGDDP